MPGWNVPEVIEESASSNEPWGSVPKIAESRPQATAPAVSSMPRLKNGRVGVVVRVVAAGRRTSVRAAAGVCSRVMALLLGLRCHRKG